MGCAACGEPSLSSSCPAAEMCPPARFRVFLQLVVALMPYEFGCRDHGCASVDQLSAPVLADLMLPLSRTAPCSASS